MEIFINYLVSIYIKKYIIYNNKLFAEFLNNNFYDYLLIFLNIV